ncbi:hypothetical protein [Mycoplasmopsis iners]|uniref:hypothetical protein n=1 Tax=Mycoplasmopsis iners TaxID=76630 RepID=UPI000496F684|nr:hypothetical protein [Mycoplasmopsis iners]
MELISNELGKLAPTEFIVNNIKNNDAKANLKQFLNQYFVISEEFNQLLSEANSELKHVEIIDSNTIQLTINGVNNIPNEVLLKEVGQNIINTKSTINKVNKSIIVLANNKGFGLYPTTMKNKLDQQNSLFAYKNIIAEYIQENFDENVFPDFFNQKFIYSSKDSSFIDRNSSENARIAKIVFLSEIVDNQQTELSFFIDDLGKNNDYDISNPEGNKLTIGPYYFWDDSLKIAGNFKTTNNKTISQITTEIKNKRTMQEQIEILKNYVDLDWKIDEQYEYFSSAKTHSHPSELHYVFGRRLKNNLNADSEIISGVISLEETS